MAFKDTGCSAKRHQKAIASEQEQKIPPGEVSLEKCGVPRYSVYKGLYTERETEEQGRWVA